jgi:hypothetical protein
MDPSGLSDEVENLSLTTRVLVQASNLVGLGVQLGCYLETAAAALDVYAHFSLLGATGVALNWVACSATGEGELPIDPVEEPPIEPAPDEPTSCSFCFAAGTPIHTDHGDVPVEEIKVGDEVESRNSATGKLELEPVTELTPLHKDSLLEIRVEGERSPLRPSTRHPFWVRRGDSPDGAWVESGKMKVGDLLQTVDGNWRRVTAITPLPGQETVYNFTVANDHDYFVGETGFLVHNAGGCGCKFALGKREGLRNWANKLGLDHFLGPANWKQLFLEQVANPQAEFNVNMSGFPGIGQGASVQQAVEAEIDGQLNTGWELQQLRDAGRLPEAKFYMPGELEPTCNPFE